MDSPYLKMIHPDAHKYPVVFSFPHSGVYVPREMRSMLVEGVILPNTDWYLPELYAPILELPITAVVNQVSRYVIDVNRGLSQSGQSYRDKLVFTTTTQGDEMYWQVPDQAEIQRRIQAFYLPYHRALQAAIAEKLRRFNHVYVLDLHSFGLDFGADIILGNHFGAGCSREMMQEFSAAFQSRGFRVKENEIYPGGYITKAYGAPERGVEVLQLEIWYAAYIAEREFGKVEHPEIAPACFRQMQEKLCEIFRAWCDAHGER